MRIADEETDRIPEAVKNDSTFSPTYAVWYMGNFLNPMDRNPPSSFQQYSLKAMCPHDFTWHIWCFEGKWISIFKTGSLNPYTFLYIVHIAQTVFNLV